jgi:ribosomal-protein-serine acetyltransferase
VNPVGGYELRALEERDAYALHTLIERNRERLARWIHWAREQTREDTLAFIGRARALEREDRGHSRGILTPDGSLAGVVGITVDPANHSAAIGYWLDAASEGRGVVTSAVADVAAKGFDRFGLVRIEIRADVENRPSCAIAERLGFQLEGIARQAYRVDEGRYSDDAVYSLLASDLARHAVRKWQIAGDAAVTQRD